MRTPNGRERAHIREWFRLTNEAFDLEAELTDLRRAVKQKERQIVRLRDRIAAGHLGMSQTSLDVLSNRDATLYMQIVQPK